MIINVFTDSKENIHCRCEVVLYEISLMEDLDNGYKQNAEWVKREKERLIQRCKSTLKAMGVTEDIEVREEYMSDKEIQSLSS